MDISKIEEMTYRRFDGVFDSMVSRDEYFTTKMIETSEKLNVWKMTKN